MERLVAGVALAAVALTACGSSSVTVEHGKKPYGADSPQAFAYDECQHAVFTSDGGLLPSVKDSLKWPDVNSSAVSVLGSGTKYLVSVTVAGDTPVGAHVKWFINCGATRRPGNRWEATAKVGNPTRA